MGNAPRFKVYVGGEYVACCHQLGDAYSILASHEDGDVRAGHRKRDVLWSWHEHDDTGIDGMFRLAKERMPGWFA